MSLQGQSPQLLQNETSVNYRISASYGIITAHGINLLTPWAVSFAILNISSLACIKTEPYQFIGYSPNVNAIAAIITLIFVLVMVIFPPVYSLVISIIDNAFDLPTVETADLVNIHFITGGERRKI